jgi:ABC-type multidrug transport system permease subunit
LGKLKEIIKKDIKMLLRSKTSSLIIILGPLLIIFLVGIAFDNTGYHNIKIAAYSPDYSDLADSYITRLSSQSYRVFKTESELACVDAVKKGTYHACIIFSPDLVVSKDLESEIKIYIDNSKLNIAWIIKDTVFEKIDDKSKELSKSLSDVLLTAFEEIKNEVDIRKKSVVDLTTKNDILIGQADSVSSKIENIKMTYDDSVPVSQISSGIDSAVSGFNSYKAKVDTIINDLDTEIDNIEGALADLNCSGSLSSIRDSISQAKDVISTSSNDTDFETAKASVEELESYLDSITREISNIKAQISVLDASKKDAKSESQSMKQGLLDQLGKIVEVQKGLNNIESKISNIQIKDSDVISDPIRTSVVPVVVEATHLTYLFPSLLVLIIMFVSLLVSSTLVQMEKISNAHFRNLISPTKTIFFNAGAFVVTLLVVMLQLLIILVITDLSFDTAILHNIFFILLVSLVSATLFILLGIFLGNIFNSEETSLLGTLVLGLALLMVSGTILPLEYMPISVRAVADFNPFVLTYQMLRDIILFRAGFDVISTEMSYMLLYVLIFGIAVFFMHNMFEKRSMKLHQRIHIPFKVLGKNISDKKPKRNIFTKQSKQYTYLKELVIDAKKILGKDNVSLEDVKKAKKLYLKIIEVYDMLPVADRKKIYSDVEFIHKEISNKNK